MAARKPNRPVTTGQVVGVLAATLVLFFMVAFASKALDAYRLRNWRDRLQGEIVQLERQQEELQAEARRRRSMAWVDEALRDAGQVPEGVVGVVVLTATPGPTPEATAAVVAAEAAVTPSPTAEAAEPGVPAEEEGLFRNPTWEAWRRLIVGFD